MATVGVGWGGEMEGQFVQVFLLKVVGCLVRSLPGLGLFALPFVNASA